MSKLEIDEALVRKLSDLLDETGLTEIEYEAGGHRIRVARSGLVQAAAAPLAAAPPAAAAAAAAETATEAVPANAVTAPMVGTAYVAAEPGDAPFVSVGDSVREGETLLIIEAMKVMNQIPSPRAGKVTRILFEDGQPVEYGEPLMTVE
jgi:acetyl-CoA carboxylase biotin carboxyl carrier protein